MILNGYTVLPDAPLAYELDRYSQQVMESLKQCSVSIHLLGSSYGLIPDGGGDSSILRLQLEVAEQCARERHTFKRLVWRPNGWKASDSKLDDLLKELQQIA